VMGDEVRLAPGNAQPKRDVLPDLLDAVKSLVDESAAYRSHFLQADAGSLLALI